MLHDGEQLDVGVTEILNVWDELIAKLAVAQPAIVVFGTRRQERNGLRKRKSVISTSFFVRGGNPVGVGPFCGDRGGQRRNRYWGEVQSRKRRDRL